jgi:mono/diheme cytochrome c family protein
MPHRCVALAALVLSLLLPAIRGAATDTIENQARAAGVKLRGCLACHASKHSEEEMARIASQVGFDARNCQGCHGNKLAGKFADRSRLNERGRWLMEQKEKRSVNRVDGAWLRDYVPPAPRPK